MGRERGLEWNWVRKDKIRIWKKDRMNVVVKVYRVWRKDVKVYNKGKWIEKYLVEDVKYRNEKKFNLEVKFERREKEKRNIMG